MAYKQIKNRFVSCDEERYGEFICDTDADFADLPKAYAGSTAVSVETGNVYVVNASGEWVKFGG